MQIHELNNFTGTLGAGAYLAVDDGNDTGKLSTQQLLAATEARIDNIIAGPAPSAEEIVDARYGADGVTYPSLGDAIRDQVTDLKSALNALTGEYANAKPMTYSVALNRINVLSAFYTVKDNILRRVILLEIITDVITSANTWTLASIPAPSVSGLQTGVGTIVYTATSLSGEDISNMAFKQSYNDSSNFAVVTTSAVTKGQGGVIMLTHDQPLTGTTVTPIAETSEPTALLNAIALKKNIYDARFKTDGYAFNASSGVVGTYNGWSYVQLRVLGGLSIAVDGLSQSASILGYGVRDASGTVVAKGGVSNGMVIDIPDDGYYLVFSYPTTDQSALILTPYYKKKVVVLGDSWSDNDPSHTSYTKWTTLLQQDGRYKVYVYAQNGSTITGDTPDYAQNGNVLGQVNKLKSDGLKNIDTIIMFGGVNDFRNGIANASVVSKIAEFYNTLNAMYPTARIIYISNHQVFITHEQLVYFHEIIDTLRNAIGLESFTTFGWVAPNHYISDHVHVDNNGYKDLYANILSILNGGSIVPIRVDCNLDLYDSGNINCGYARIKESWDNGFPSYSARVEVFEVGKGKTITRAVTSSQNLLLASVPFTKLLNKGMATSPTIEGSIFACDASESFSTANKMNSNNTLTFVLSSENSGYYYSDNHN